MRFLWLLVLGLSIPIFSPGQLLEYKTSAGWGLMDRNGEIVLEAAYDYINTSRDRMYFYLQNREFSALYKKGHGLIIPMAFHRIFPADSGRFYLVLDGKYGVADSSGKVRIRPQYDQIRYLIRDVYAVENAGKWGAANLAGNLYIPCEYLSASLSWDIWEPQLHFLKEDSTTVLYSLSGVQLSTDTFTQPAMPIDSFSFGTALLYRQNSMLGILDSNAQILTPAIYDSIIGVDSIYMVSQRPYWGLLNAKGAEALPIEYDKLEPDNQGPWWIEKNRLWGLASPAGKLLIEPQYQGKSPFFGLVAKVRNQTKYGLINQRGDQLAEVRYSNIQIMPRAAKLWSGTGSELIAFDEEGALIDKPSLVVASNPNDRRGVGIRNLSIPRGLALNQSGPSATNRVPNTNWVFMGQYPGDFNFMSMSIRRETNGKQFQYLYHDDFLTESVARIQDKIGRFGLIWNTGRYKSFAGATYIGPFRGGIARIRFGGRKINPNDSPEKIEKQLLTERANWSLIRKNGLSLSKTPEKLQYIGDFYQATAPFKQKGKWGLIDSSMKEVISPELDGLRDPGPDTDLLIYWKETPKYLLFSEEGKYFKSWVMDLEKDSTLTLIEEMHNFHDGLAAAKSARKWGFVDTSGTFVIEPQFDEIQDFEHGLAAASIKRNWGFIDHSGQWKIKNRFRQVRVFKEGIAAVRGKNGWGMVDENGKWVLKAKYREVKDFEEGFALVKDRKWGVIDARGKWVVKPLYGELEKIGEYFRVRDQGLFGYFSKTGQVIIPMEYNWLGEMQEDKISFLENSKYGFMNVRREVIIPPAFDRATHFSEGLAAVNLDRKWGYIDGTGKWKIKAEYERALPFEKGLAFVAIRDKNRRLLWGAIDKKGLIRIPLIHQSIRIVHEQWLLAQNERSYQFYDRLGVPAQLTEVEKAVAFKGNHSLIQQNSIQQLFNNYLYPPLPTCYTINHFPHDGRLLAEVPRQYGFYNRKGEKVMDARFDYVEFVDGVFRVFVNGKLGYLDNEGQWILPVD